MTSKKNATSDLLDSTVYATLGRPHLQTELSTRNTNFSHKILDPIINPCATGTIPLLMPSRRPVAVAAVVSTFKSFEGVSSNETPSTPTITLPNPQNSTFRQKQQAQLALAAVAAANSRNNRSKETMDLKYSNTEEDTLQTKLKENQYWV